MRWTAELQDKISKEAKLASGALRDLEESLKAAGDGAEDLGEKGERGMDAFAEKIAWTQEKIHLLVDGIEKGVEKALEFGKFTVEAGEFKRNALLGFQHVLGTREAAQETVEEAESLATKAGLPLQAVVGQFQELSAVGVKSAHSMRVLVAAAHDFEDMKLGGSEDLISAITRIAGRGQLAGSALRQLQPIGKDLANVLGYGTFDALQKGLEKAPLAAQQAIPAIVKAIRAHGGGSVVGELTKDVGGGVEGGITKIKDNVERVLGTVGESPAFTKVGTSLEKLAAIFDPKSDFGKKLEEQLEHLAEAAGKFIDKIIEHKDEILKFIKELAKDLKEIAPLLGSLGGGAVKAAFNHKETALGIAAGTAVAGPLGAAVGGLTGAYVEQKNEQVERLQAAGVPYERAVNLSLPKFASGAYADTPTAAIVGDAGPEWILPEGKLRSLIGESTGGGRGVELHLSFGDIHVEGRGKTDEEIASMIIERLHDEAPGALISAIEQIGLTAS